MHRDKRKLQYPRRFHTINSKEETPQKVPLKTPQNNVEEQRDFNPKLEADDN
jgi:hypothetical protein